MVNSEQINDIIGDYNSIINKFKLNDKVYNGSKLAWKGGGVNLENKPKDYGTGTTTTGFCVSASEALLKSVAFKSLNEMYGAYAKLISIDIKEQYWGYCYNGSQNKWHTAILVAIEDFNFVVDITCGQFGNEYVNKNLWFVDSWLTKFRSGMCTHQITDFTNKPLDVNPTSKAKRGKHELMYAKYNLQNYTKLEESERLLLINFIENLETLNDKLILGSYNKEDIKMFETVVDLYKNKMGGSFPIPESYTTLRFENKRAAFKWLNHNINFSGHDENSIIDFGLKQNLLAFRTIGDSRNYYKLNNQFNNESTEKEYGNNDYLLNIKMLGVYGSKNFTKSENFIVFAGTPISVSMDNLVVDKTNAMESTVLFIGEASTDDNFTQLNESQNFSDESMRALGKIIGSDWKNEPALEHYLSNENGDLRIALGEIKELTEKELIELSGKINTSKFETLNQSTKGKKSLKRIKNAVKSTGRYLSKIAED